MGKHRRIVLAASVIAIVGGLVWLLLPPREIIRVTGNLSTKDVSEIEAGVRRFRRHEILPSFSWGIVHNVSAKIKEYFRPIDSIQGSSDGTNAAVLIGPLPVENTSTNNITFSFDNRTTNVLITSPFKSNLDIYFAQKTPSGWVITSGGRIPGKATILLAPPPPLKK